MTQESSASCEPATQPTKIPRSIISPSFVAKQVNICAKLVTIRSGRKEAIVLNLNKPAIIGRNPDLCSYLVPGSLVSGVHCKIYAVRSPSGGVIVSCQDMSRNGIKLNGQHIRKTAIILMDGDTLELPDSLAFTCVHLSSGPKEKRTIFDPTPPAQPIQKKIGRFIVTSQCLGSGSFATVHLALDPVQHRQVACKSIKVKRQHEITQVMKEVRILMTLKHPNINQIYDTEDDKQFIHIFLQLCTGGDLFTYITNHASGRNRLCEAEAKYVMYQLLQALLYLHDKMISHRDLKPENILLHTPEPYPRILLADFGLARPNAYQETLNVCGTVSYLPPEGVLALDHKDLGYMGMPADCWSAGVILYVMLTGTHPFDNEPPPSPRPLSECPRGSSVGSGTMPISQRYLQMEGRLKERIVRGQVSYDPSIWDNLDEAQDLVNDLLIQDYQFRGTVRSALESAWIAGELEELEELYQQRVLGNDN